MPLQVRAGLAPTVSQLADARLLAHRPPPFILSTCLRIEIAWDDQDGEPPGGLRSDLGVLRTGEEAFTHLCRVAAGLDSPLVGEPEILAQFRHAVGGWRKTSGPDYPLGSVLEAAVGVARAVRRHLEPVQQGSLAVLAAQAAVPPVAILGSGAMARAAAEHLGDEATVFARRPTHVAGRATHDWRAAAEALSRYASVISAVPGSTPLFAPADLATALARRRGPLLVLDLGLPPGFEPSLLGDKVRYLGIDDLASAVTPAPSPAAWKHLEQAAPAAWSRLAAPDRVGKVIAEILERADNAVLEEVERFYDRLVQTRDPDRILRQLAHTVARRVLHRPISYIGSTAAEADTVDLLAEAFGVGE